MTQKNSVQVEARPATEFGKEWEGLIVNGEFHLRQYVGGSDHSAVFLTEYDDKDPQQAAIKLIPEDSGSAELQLSRWELATELSHPHLLRIFQIGRCQLANVRLLYIVMDYAEENLSQILPNRALTPEETRAMLPPALDALAYIHGKGLVHGRVKPSNIMASGDELKLSADGLSRVGETASESSPYSPPEARSAGLSAAGDVWSLGMTLVEVLTQRLPVWERLEEKGPIIPEYLPAPFFDIARNCLHRDSRQRWTASDIAVGLQIVTSPEGKETPKATKTITPAVPDRSPKRSYVAPALIIGLLLAAIAMGPKLLKREPNKTSIPPAAANSILEKRQGQEQLKKATVPAAAIAPKSKRNSVDITTSPAGSDSQNGKMTATATVPEDVIHQVLPDVPQKARDTIHGIVRVVVGVGVDGSGNVTQAALESPKPSRYFAGLALQAARQWQFRPSKVNGENSLSEWTLQFDFSPQGTKAIPTRATPPRHGQ